MEVPISKNNHKTLIRVLLVATSLLSGALVTGISTYVVWVKDALTIEDVVTRSQISEMIAVQAPYVAERALILEFMSRTNGTLEAIQVEQREQRDIAVETQTKLDILLRQGNP